MNDLYADGEESNDSFMEAASYFLRGTLFNSVHSKYEYTTLKEVDLVTVLEAEKYIPSFKPSEKQCNDIRRAYDAVSKARHAGGIKMKVPHIPEVVRGVNVVCGVFIRFKGSRARAIVTKGFAVE